MGWTEHIGEAIELETATAEETLLLTLSLREPRDAEEMIPHLDRHAVEIEARLRGRGRWVVLQAERPSGWLFGPLGMVGPLGLLALALAGVLTWIFTLRFALFVIVFASLFVLLKVLAIKPDRRNWLAVGTPLGAGVVAAWAIRRRGGEAPQAYDQYLTTALINGPEYWHDLAGRAVEQLPMNRRERIVLEAFSDRPDDLWHLLPHVPTEKTVRAALVRGPRSSATADFHAFGSLIRQTRIEPVLEAILAGAGNRDVLIRAVASSGNPAAVHLLIGTLAERNDRLRRVAREGLVAMGPSVLPSLFGAFSTPDGWVQQGLARALRDMGPDAQIEQFCAKVLHEGRVDESAASNLRRIVLTRRVLASKLNFVVADIPKLDRILSQIPAPALPIPPLFWHGDQPMSPAAAWCVADLLASEGPDLRSAELSGLRHLLEARSKQALEEHAEVHAAHPRYRMVLSSDAAVLRYHHGATKVRAQAEEWVDVLERHASLAAVHALDELWRRGVDGGVQTAAMASLMRLCGEYDGLETFADRALRDVLRDVSNPLHESFARGQFSRFEQMMITARRLEQSLFHALYQTTPAQHVLWGAYDPSGILREAFRIDEDYVPVDDNDERVEFPRGYEIGVAHPAELGETASRRWAEVFSDYELVPHFEQLQRPARHLSVDEAYSDLFVDFADAAPGGRLEQDLIRRGWRPSPTDIETVYTLTKPVQRGTATYTAVIELTPGFGEDADESQRIDCLAFWNGHHHVFSSVVQKVNLGRIDAVVFSEVVLELRELLATAATNDERSLPAILTPTKE